MFPRFILINKKTGPARNATHSVAGGPTSHDIIDRLRQITGIKKIGHAGTLDPFASGLLLVAIERESTRELSKFVGLDKEYIATLKLGAVSDTYDRTGKIKIQEYKNIKINKNIIERALKKFIGKQKQIPPMYSAKKVKGKRLYKLARKGVEIKRKPHEIEIYNLLVCHPERSEGSRDNPDELVLKIHCSSGTYIRTLAHDIGKKLKYGAYLQELVRTKIGKYKLENAVEVDKLNKDNWQKFCLNTN